MGYTVYYNNENNPKSLQNPEPHVRENFKKDFLKVMELFEIPELDEAEDLEALEKSVDPYASRAKVHCRYQIFWVGGIRIIQNVIGCFRRKTDQNRR